MRKVCLASLFVFVLASPAPAQNWANKLFEGGNANAAIIQDFGTVARGAQLEANLKMTNIWKVPLNVTEIRVSCGCTEAKAFKTVNGVPVAELTPSGPSLQPNETAVLNIKMDGTRFNGPKQVNVSVTVGPQFVSSAQIVVSANARQDVVLNPGEIDFGNVQRGSPVDRSLEVECAGKPNWKVTQVNKGANAPFDLRIENLPARVNNGAQVVGYRLIATLKPSAPVGTFRDTVDLMTSDPTQPKVTFIVAGTVLAPITAAPNPLQAVGLKVGSPYSGKVFVSSSQPFRIIGIQGNDPEGTLVATGEADKNHFVELNITPKTPGLLNREFILQTDMRNESVKVVIKGNVNP